MNQVSAYIESGILELYVLGMVNADELKEVQQMAAAHSEIRKEIEEISKALEVYAGANAVAPHPAVKPMLMATIDYSERMKNGEPATFPPILNEHSRIADYGEWLNRTDMILPNHFDELFAKLIGYTAQATTAIVWIKSMAPHEVHHDEFERFLIVEGTCDIIIGEKTYQLIAGDYLQIPLHQGHHVKVTSAIPCKVILQRIAA
jgi:mannose-6-phosphate isomerase-like protein (cupin superfamily)